MLTHPSLKVSDQTNKQTNNPKNSLIVPANIRSMGHFRQQRRIMWFICSEQHHLPCTTRDTIPRYYSIDLEKLNLSLDQEYLIGIENTFSHSMVFSPAFIFSTIYDSKLVPHNMVSASAVSTKADFDLCTRNLGDSALVESLV